MDLGTYKTPAGSVTYVSTLDEQNLTLTVHAVSDNGVELVKRYPEEPSLDDAALRSELERGEPLEHIVQRRTIEQLTRWRDEDGGEHQVLWIRGVGGATLVVDVVEQPAWHAHLVAQLTPTEGKEQAKAAATDWLRGLLNDPTLRRSNAHRFRVGHLLEPPEELKQHPRELIGKRLPAEGGEIELTKYANDWRWLFYAHGSNEPRPIRLIDALNRADVYDVFEATYAIAADPNIPWDQRRHLAMGLRRYDVPTRIPIAKLQQRIIRGIENREFTWQQVHEAVVTGVLHDNNKQDQRTAKRLLGLAPSTGRRDPNDPSKRTAETYNVTIEASKARAIADALGLSYPEIGL